ncbi:Carboxypeptidase regulatory-like domain-containing protein [Sulfidibacter corallicola]|uniref:Carboxypeptidase regulatory-like domain-containing protein n=1 Tax=Sulfidibacter corallicola TaxID=2818388 RepID=A0A8A4TEY5_SULCO|nr:carboxypeptidase-like regulatory domain-containing protein [Sulfidibacter corallicola]QTD47782.1 carboxypeptidase regulatory-like domain-containing protein [Sulfidibacter corallicola]
MRQLVCIALLLVGSLAMAQKSIRGSVVGKVIGMDGQPVQGVNIDITFEAEDLQKYNKTGLTTKANGGFVQVGMPSGRATLSLSGEGMTSRTYVYVQDQSRKELEIRMLKEGEIITDLGEQPNVSGVITDSAGAPIPTVEITLSSQDFPGYEQKVVSGDDGFFELKSIAEASVQIYAKKEGYRDEVLRYNHTKGNFKLKTGEFRMLTIEEAMREMGLDPNAVKQPELSTRDKAIMQYNEAVDPYQNKDYAAAEEFAKKASEIDPTFDKAIKLVVYTNYYQQDWPEVMSYVDKYLEIDPEDADMAKIAMEAAQKSKNNDSLKKYKNKLNELVPVTPQSLYAEMVNSINANDDDTAKAKALEILKMDNTFANAYFELGRIYVREGDFDEAIRNLKLYIKHDPNGQFRQDAIDLIETLAE